MDFEREQRLIEELKKRTAMTAYALNIEADEKPDIFSSKFGGVPYWDLEKDYPKDREGNKLVLLAQINFDRVDVEEPLPQRGMLQFFIGSDELYGLNFDAPDRQDTFRVVYHETVREDVTEEQVRSLGIPVSTDAEDEDCTPVFEEAAVSIEKKTVYMGLETYEFDELFMKVIREKFPEELACVEDAGCLDVLDEDSYERLWEELSNQGHWLLGYPAFTQTDPREYEERYRVYDTLLFQMDSDRKDGKDYVLWGDCGVGNFFINREDLKKCDFSKVLYNWDCC